MFNKQPKGDTLLPLSTPKDAAPFHYQMEMLFIGPVIALFFSPRIGPFIGLI